MELAKPTDGEAFRDDARGAIRVQPGRCKAGLRWESIEINSSHLEACEDLFNHPFEVVELNSPRRVKGADIRKRACSRKGQRRAFVDLFRGSAEDSAEFEEAHVADVAMEVSGDGRKHAGNKRWTQHARFVAEGVPNRHYLARC